MSMNVSGDVVRKLRRERGWTQEHLAQLTGRNVRTIQRVENAGICDIETRSALAAAFTVESTQLDEKQMIELSKWEAEDGPLHYQRIASAQALVDIFAGADWYRYSNEEPRYAEDAKYASDVLSQLQCYAQIWGDIGSEDRVKGTVEIGELLNEIESKGFRLFGVRTRANHSVLTLDVTGRRVNIKVSNLHIAYGDSKRIIALGMNG